MSNQDVSVKLEASIKTDEQLKAAVNLKDSCNEKINSSLTKDEDLLVSLKVASHLDYDK